MKKQKNVKWVTAVCSAALFSFYTITSEAGVTYHTPFTLNVTNNSGHLVGFVKNYNGCPLSGSGDGLDNYLVPSSSTKSPVILLKSGYNDSLPYPCGMAYNVVIKVNSSNFVIGVITLIMKQSSLGGMNSYFESVSYTANAALPTNILGDFPVKVKIGNYGHPTSATITITKQANPKPDCSLPDARVLVPGCSR